ncbi:hypothetical protein [uncultured Paludibaculum sp.]|uniref:hypothetical protein n=1 Tax=uncultured Paludibaculum sp. TaxID=1765020 RepID=UPI002AAB42F7|nr:hypothetical protein [uncultured Paludibaculum sp.]
MTKQLAKRHKRQVARAKQKIKLSEPDVRTPEQIKAAREASAPAGGWRSGPSASYAGPSSRNQGSQSADTRSKGES